MGRKIESIQKPTGTAQQRILDAAEKLFSEKGFAATSVQEIADTAKVNKAMIFYYFSSKEDLLTAAVERVISGIEKAIQTYFEDKKDKLEGIDMFINFYVDYLAKNRAFVRLMMWEMLSGKNIPVLAKKYFMPVFQHGRESINGMIKGKKIRPVSPEHTLISIVGMNVFYIIASPLIGLIFNDDPLSPKNLARRKIEVKSLILKGVYPEK
jgi:AcrR family transcriptional regulator